MKLEELRDLQMRVMNSTSQEELWKMKEEITIAIMQAWESESLAIRYEEFLEKFTDTIKEM